MEQRFSEMAARAMRMLVAFDYRTPDEFEQVAFASVMAKNPSLIQQDYDEAITVYHNRPQPRKMRAGDLVEAARKVRDRRTDAQAVESGNIDNAVPRPSNYRQMVTGMTQIVKEFKAEGVNPTNEDVMKEFSRRVRESN